MRVRASAIWLVLIVSSGCADSCACGRKVSGGAAPATTTTPEGKAGAGAGAVKPGAGQAGGAAPAPNRPAWQPAPDSPLTRQLRGAQKVIEQDQMFDKVSDPKTLERAFGDKLGKLQADGPASSTLRTTDKNDLAVSARNYRGGETTVRVKITDTAKLPTARRVVSNRLTLIGNEAAGDEHGMFVRGYPAVSGHFDAQKVSRATALIGGRYLVQIMVQGAEHPDDALRYLDLVDWTRLAPKQGKLPKPEAEPAAAAPTQ